MRCEYISLLHSVIDFLHPFLLSLGFTLISVLVFFYTERKASAFMQDRMGPTHVGWAGLLQPAADLLKLLGKETIVPAKARKSLFILAPFLIFIAVFSGFAIVPIVGDGGAFGQIPGGVLLLLGVISIDAIAILMASYASQSKFPMLGAGRAVAQMVSYEVPLGISILCFFWLANSAELSVIENLQTKVFQQPFGWMLSWRSSATTESVGFLGWNIIQHPVLCLLLPGFYACILAESNRAPFDIPEGESEIIGGFHTEYSGFLWAVFFLAEYAMMLILSLLMSFLFFGGKASPFPSIIGFSWLSDAGFFWLWMKSWMICFSMIWVRWSLPRLRVDQLLTLSWKIFTPIAMVVFLLCVLFN